MTINLEQLLAELKKEVTEKRYQHSLGVVESAKELAERFTADQEKVIVAAVLHDYCKNWPKTRLSEIIKENQREMPPDLLVYNNELWHGPVAALVAKNKFSINDEDILNAIKYHTSGREKMSQIEKIVCLADYIEPSRVYPYVEQLRAKAKEDLNCALLLAFTSTIEYLEEKNEAIYPLTLDARNYLAKQCGEE